MKALIAEEDRSLRDMVMIGLETMGDIEIDVETGAHVLDRATKKDYDFLVYELVDDAHRSWDDLEKLQKLDSGPQILVIGRDLAIKKLASMRVGNRIFSTMKTPLQPLDFYKTMSRFKRRLLDRGPERR